MNLLKALHVSHNSYKVWVAVFFPSSVRSHLASQVSGWCTNYHVARADVLSLPSTATASSRQTMRVANEYGILLEAPSCRHHGTLLHKLPGQSPMMAHVTSHDTPLQRCCRQPLQAATVLARSQLAGARGVCTPSNIVGRRHGHTHVPDGLIAAGGDLVASGNRSTPGGVLSRVKKGDNFSSHERVATEMCTSII